MTDYIERPKPPSREDRATAAVYRQGQPLDDLRRVARKADGTSRSLTMRRRTRTMTWSGTASFSSGRSDRTCCMSMTRMTSSANGCRSVSIVDDLITWLRAQLDDDERVIAAILLRILDLHAGEHDCPEMVTGTYPADWPEAAPWGKAGEPWAHPSIEHFEAGEPCPTVRTLAQPYADRPGFRKEWRAAPAA